MQTAMANNFDATRAILEPPGKTVFHTSLMCEGPFS